MGRVTAVVTEQISAFFLPDLVAVYRISFEKCEVGIQLKIVVAVKELIFDDVVSRRHRYQLHVGIGAAGFASFVWVNRPIKANQSRLNSPVGNLAGRIPLAVKG